MDLQMYIIVSLDFCEKHNVRLAGTHHQWLIFSCFGKTSAISENAFITVIACIVIGPLTIPKVQSYYEPVASDLMSGVSWPVLFT